MPVDISKEVTIQLAGGQSKQAILGGEETCSYAQPRGWGTMCETLVKREDGLYHCGDCGLVFTRIIFYKPPETNVPPCGCERVVNDIEWFFNEFFGYDCPQAFYRCEKCGWTYQAPHFANEAPVRVQESAAARRHVKWYLKHMGEEKRKAISHELEKAIKKLSPAAKQRLLKQLSGT